MTRTGDATTTTLRLLCGLAAWAFYVQVGRALPEPARQLAVPGAIALVVVTSWRWGKMSGVLMAVCGGIVTGVLSFHSTDELADPSAAIGFVISLTALLSAAFLVGGWADAAQAQLADAIESEARQARAAEAADVSGWELDFTAGRVRRSERLLTLLADTSGVLDQPLSTWLTDVHQEDVDPLRAELEAARRGEREQFEGEQRLRRRDGSWIWTRMRARLVRDASGRPAGVTAFFSELEPGARAQATRHPGFHDALTGLPNRALFLDRLKHALSRAKRPPAHAFAVLSLDLDGFGRLNAELGGELADAVLNKVVERLQAVVREGDTLARVGADEFGILLERVESDADAERVAEQLQRTVSAPISLDGGERTLSASVGIVVAREGGCETLSLLRQVDAALATAKRQGPGQRVLFDALAHSEWGTRLSLEGALRGLSAEELRVHYQPIVDVARREIRGFEALVRWQHPSLGSVPTSEVVAIAEESGWIGELGAFVLEQACRALKRLAKASPSAEFFMCVNLSGAELGREDLAEHVVRVLDETGVDARSLVLDVRESALLGDNPPGQTALRSLRKRGVRVHMDDFGTGYASLSYLHRCELDALKIDGSIVQALGSQAGPEEIARTTIEVAHTLHLRVIAEGVENETQLRRLTEFGCDQAQGFLFGAPMPIEELEALVRRGLSPAPRTRSSRRAKKAQRKAQRSKTPVAGRG